MPGSVNGAVRQDIQAIYARGANSSACATGRPAFINLLAESKNDPITLFKQQPHQTINAKELVYHEARKNLPADFLQKELSPEGNKIRMLIGVIYKDVQESGNETDIAKLDKICKKLADANGNENKEQKVEKDLSALVSNYSKVAFEKVINQYIGHCIEAWEMYHQAKSVDTQEKTIFKQCLDVCKSTLQHDVEGLTQPDQPWETMAQKLNFFVNDCAAISKTLTFYNAEPVTPAPKGPEPLNLKPDDSADNQRLFIPTTPGQGGITLNITNKAGDIGDITHSVGSATTGPADSNSAIVKHILDSGLTNVEKVGLIKDLFNANAGRTGNFLGNLASVQGFKQELAADTQQVNVARQEIETQTPKPSSQSISTQTDIRSEKSTVVDANIGSEPSSQQQPVIMVEATKLNTVFDGGVSKTQNLEGDNLNEMNSGEKKEQPVRSFLSNGDYIDTTSHTIAPFNQINAAPAASLPTDPESKSDRASGKVVTLEDGFEALKKRDPSAFDHLDKNDTVPPLGEKGKSTAEQYVEQSSTDGLIDSERESPLSSQEWRDGSAADGEAAGIKMANPGTDSVDGGTLSKKGEINQINAAPAHSLPTEPESKSDRASGKVVTLEDRFEALKKRDPSAFDHLDKNDNVPPLGEKGKSTTEQYVEQSSTDGLIDSERESPLNSQEWRNGSATDGEAAGIKMANPGTDSVDGGTLRKKSEFNQMNAAPAHSLPTDPESKSDRVSGKVVTLEDRFEALKKRDPSAFDHLDKNDTVPPLGEKGKSTAEQYVEQSSTDGLIDSERESPLNSQEWRDGSATDGEAAGIKMANPGTDSVDGGTLRKKSEQVNQKSVAGSFQPARFNSEAVNPSGNKSVNNRIYTTVRTVNLWNRESEPVNFLPTASGADSAELDKVFSGLSQRDLSALDALDNKKSEQPRGLLPFQKKLAELKRRSQQ